MAVSPEGAPCWADAMFNDVEGARRFYGDVLGWTFGESSSEYGNYTLAYAGGRAAAAVIPPMPGQAGKSQWCLYLASPDAADTARKIRDNGGEILMEPMQVADFGWMCLARDPGGSVFGVWQAGSHPGFETEEGRPGAFAWAEVFTREPAASDAFFPAVFGYTSREMQDESMDFRVYYLGERPALGRMEMGDDFPPEVPPYINVYFGVTDCDEAVSKATGLGGVLQFGPMDTPFGRVAALTDPQGAAFSVIDTTKAEGEMPPMTEV
ncbi:VOC family protein [Streptomyces sp. SBST2-5]|uniref:VOC family protein n=1 Tax=Streptomyces composti TaxID=2720025 RepID=A0ABX1AI61_9ACTN|nr:VOC family protein [Streptomyces composti]NJP53266.1 VOC family protein [Streptomyces composti]